MATRKELYEPAARFDHVSFSVEEKLYLWGGKIQGLISGSKNDGIECIEQFDLCLEVWSPLNTAGTPHLGEEYTASACAASSEEHVYMYGGIKGGFKGALSCLNVKSLTWSRLSQEGRAPMRKAYCGMVHFHQDKLAVIGGYGIPTGPIQPGSTFIMDTRFTDGRGWTNEIHVFDLSQGSHSQVH